MKLYSLHFKQTINRPIEEVFDFFSKPENLSRITPKKLNFKILTPTPIKMMKGQIIDYTIRLIGFQIHWRTLITDYNPPYSFIDQQIKGPYTIWHHKHTFKKIANGVEIYDNITYSIPFGIIGRILHYVWIQKDLENIFRYRKKVINEIFNMN
tara:strand:- start:81 stop:539 length:459 start_codon:yes stop_codon:yes gene_type:complete